MEVHLARAFCRVRRDFSKCREVETPPRPNYNDSAHAEEELKMPSTHVSLIDHAQSGSARGWGRLVETYQPIVYRYLRREGVAHDDASDLTQDVLTVLVRELETFQHNGRTGGFRRWLRQITIHRLLMYRRSRKRREVATGGSSFLQQLQEFASDECELADSWDREFDRALLKDLFERVESEFEPTTMAAFRMLAIQQESPEAVAAELGLSVGAVYSAKSRVLRRLRQAADALKESGELSDRSASFLHSIE
jgi:RNA polymerase sigma-70 factor (ECF subfamily)